MHSFQQLWSDTEAGKKAAKQLLNADAFIYAPNQEAYYMCISFCIQ